MKLAVEVTCPCGTAFATTAKRIEDGRGRYCSRPCMYRFRVRPSGLTYQKHKENPTSFKPGHRTWNDGIKGLHLSPTTEFKPGQRSSPATEFKIGERPWNAGTTDLMPTGEAHHAFKGDAVGYAALHQWVTASLGRPSACEHCGALDVERRLEWANRSREYRRDLSDWIGLCKPCHYQFDKHDLGAIARKWGTKV